jgi:Flp pilus assembly protein CpaB
VDAPPANNKPSRAALVLPLDKVAAVLQVEATTSAGAAARAGDRIDVLGYFSRQVTGQDNVTRVLLQEVSVLAVDRSGPNVSLTLAVPQQEALLLQEAQALGARAFVALRPAQAAGDTLPRTTFSDTDLASRLAGASTLR